MNTLSFLRLIAPASGGTLVAFIKEFKTKDGKTVTYPKFIRHESAESAAAAIAQLDENGEDIFFTVNAMGDWYEDPDRPGKKVIKKKENVIACRSLFDDFDVDQEKKSAYDTREEAFNDLKRFAKAVGLMPTIVSSGGGFHCYISVDEDITPEEWEELSARKRDITNHLNMKVDRAVDMDSSRIMRPIGSHNLKTGTPRPVKLIAEGRAYPVEHVRRKFAEYIEANNVTPSRIANRDQVANPFAAAVGEHPPSDPQLVAAKCAAIGSVVEAGGAVEEPMWYAMLGTIKHCTAGEDFCHEWSKGDDRYDATICQSKIDQWEKGPASCEHFNSLCGCGESCKYYGKIKFPIVLGHTEVARSVEKDTAPQHEDGDIKSAGSVIEGMAIPYWPEKGYMWNGSQLCKAVVTDDDVQWKPFCNSLIFPANRIRLHDGTWMIHWKAKEKNGAWREFFMETNELASSDMMAKTFASHEVFLPPTPRARTYMSEFASGLIEKLQEYRIETRTYGKFGWTDEYDGFVIGTKMIRADKEENVLCSDHVPGDINADFGTSGTLEDWKANIDFLYNRPGAEIMQFALCHAMGSSLVQIMGTSNWHGLTMALVSGPGTGKSTIAKIACGFYGNPSKFEKQGNDDGSTIMAAVKRVAVMGSLPIIMDEMSGRKPDDLTKLGYALANGREKDRLKPDGSFATVGDEWFKNSFASSNESLHDMISKLPGHYKVEATQLRFFEVPVPNDYIETTFSDVDRNFVEHHMDNVYGVACRPFLRYVMQNRQSVKKLLLKARAKYNPKSQEDTKERFYYDTVVTALAAGIIARKLGLIAFDVNAMAKWAVRNVKELREVRQASKMDISDYVSSYIGSLNDHLIVTQHLNDSRSKEREAPIDRIIGSPLGRIAIKDKKVFVTVKSVSDWCKDHGVAPKALRDELEQAGIMKINADGSNYKSLRLAAGTTLPSSVTRCHEFHYDALFGGRLPIHVVGKATDGVAESAT